MNGMYQAIGCKSNMEIHLGLILIMNLLHMDIERAQFLMVMVLTVSKETN